MTVRKLKLVWQQVNDSASRSYQPWSLLNVDKPRKMPMNNINASMTTNELRNVFAQQAPPITSMPIISHVQSPMPVINTEQTPLMNSPALSKPSVYQAPIDNSASVFLQTPAMPYSPLDLLPKSQQTNLEPLVAPMEENKEVYNRESEQQQRKRAKVIDTRPVEIDIDEDEDGAERKRTFILNFNRVYFFN